MDPNLVGERIRKLRKARGLTLESLAGGQFTKGYLSLIERGKTPPSFRVISFIAERLGCALAELLGSDGESEWWAGITEDFRAGRFREVIDAAGHALAGDAAGPRGAQARLWQARAFIETRDYGQCIDAVSPLIGRTDFGPAFEVETCYLMARASLGLQRFSESVAAAESGLQKARSNGIVWPDLCARMRLNLATALMGLDRFSEAIDAFTETLDFARAHNQPGTAVDALIRKAFCHLRIGDQARALVLAQMARNVRDAIGDAVQQAEARIVLTMAAIAGNDRTAALAYAQEAADLLAAHPPTRESVEASTTLARLLTDLGQQTHSPSARNDG